MRSSRIRSLLVTAVVLVFAVLGWFYLAPTNIGGSTTYVVTHGISMEPLIHAGDLALVRPEDHYRVGQVVAYHSTLLNTVVLHRIIRIDHGHYFFKGDNNSFIDPTHPTRSLLIGSMWLHIAGGGTILHWLHEPWLAAILLGAVAAFLLFGGGRRRRRRDRGRRHDGGRTRVRGVSPVTSADSHPGPRVSDRQLFQACVAGALVFLALCIFAFVRPADNTTAVTHPYTQTLRFGYHANVGPSSVYPSGTVATGDPVYIALVHALTVGAAYQLKTAPPYRLHGTIGIRGTLSNSSGWSRRFWLARPMPFVGASARTAARIDLNRFESLASRISAQIGSSGGSYNLAVTPSVKIAGTVAGHPLSTSYTAALNIGVGESTLLGGGSAINSTSSTGVAEPSGGSAQSGLVHSSTGTATTLHSSTATIAGVPVEVIRWLALLAFALCGWGAWRFRQHERENPPAPADRISSRYKHLIVPVEPFTPDPDHPPIEVSSIDALAQLAERSERLILHDHQQDVDNYLIDDQGTLYLYSAPRVSTAIMNGASAADGTDWLAAEASVEPAAEASVEPAIDEPEHDRIPERDATPERDRPPERRRARDRRRVAERRGTGEGAGDDAPAPGEPGARGPGLSDLNLSDLSLTDPGLIDPERSDPAAIIFRSAAAHMSAAATKTVAGDETTAGDEAPEESGAHEPGDRRTGEDRRAGADRRVGVDRRDDSGGPAGSDSPEGDEVADAPMAAAEDAPAGRDWVRGTASTNQRSRRADPEEVRSRRVPDLLVLDGEPHQPPIPAPPRWTSRPEVRAGFALGPIALCLIAWQRVRARRRRMRGDDAIESTRRSWETRNSRRR